MDHKLIQSGCECGCPHVKGLDDLAKNTLLQNGKLAKALTDLLDCLETTGNWTQSDGSVALWLTVKEDQRLDELESRARQALNGVPEKSVGEPPPHDYSKWPAPKTCELCRLRIVGHNHVEPMENLKCVHDWKNLDGVAVECKSCGIKMASG
jgi:hypothetical protein